MRNQKIGLLTLRLLLGIIFFMQGWGKVVTWGLDNVYQNVFNGEQYQMLPDWLRLATAYYTSYVELIAGFLLIIGLKRDYALYALASVLVLVSFGHGMASPIWDLSHVMYRAILLLALLLLPKDWDSISMDYWLKTRKKSS